MVQLEILTGQLAGQSRLLPHIPSSVGRSAAADLRLEEAGIWDRHLRLKLDPARGFVLLTEPGALTCVNGETVQEAVLRSGDIIAIGPVNLRFSLSDTRQRSQRAREAATWFALAGLSLGQIPLIYWLLR